MLKNTAVVLLVLLILFASRIRIITAENQLVVLLARPFRTHSISGSVSTDIRNNFSEVGKNANRVMIRYAGTNSNGDFFLCEYEEPDGSVSKYYAFNDTSPNNYTRAKIFWE